MLRSHQEIDIVLPHFSSRIEVSLTERRTAAAFPVLQQLNFESERVQYLDRRNSNVRFVITYERVVPQNHFAAVVAAVSDRRIILPTLRERRYRRMFCEPFVEPLPRVMRQRSFRGNAERCLHQAADRGEIDNGICQPWNGAADSAQQIDIAEKSLAHWQTIALVPRVKHFRFQQREIDVRRALRRATFARQTIA